MIEFCTLVIYDASSSVLVTAEIYENSVPEYSWASHGCSGYYYRRGSVRLCWYQHCSPKKLPLARLSPSFDPCFPCVTVSPSRTIPPRAQPGSLARDLRLEFPRPPPRFCFSALPFCPVSCKIKVTSAHCCRTHVIYLRIKVTDFFCCSIMFDKYWLCVFASCNDILMSCKSFSRSSTCKGVTLTHIGLPCEFGIRTFISMLER